MQVFYSQKCFFTFIFFILQYSNCGIATFFISHLTENLPQIGGSLCFACRNYFSRSFSHLRRLDSFIILSMRFCILCPGCGHGSSNTVTFIHFPISSVNFRYIKSVNQYLKKRLRIQHLLRSLGL